MVKYGRVLEELKREMVERWNVGRRGGGEKDVLQGTIPNGTFGFHIKGIE